MTVTESSKAAPETAGVPVGDAGRVALPEDVIEGLLAQVRADGVELLGEGGVINELTKRLLERALDEELTDHLGYERGDPAGRGSGNNRNGTTPKRVLTEIGAVDLDVPRDRDASFEPKIVPKGTTRLAKFNANVIALYAQGLSTREIKKALKRMYDVDVSPDLISRVTDGVVDELRDWQNRPLVVRLSNGLGC
ncbi:MAG TPA: transposase [Acidimicrobiales bacterium]|nr:transposase [Acidimicrobiales bacterium]